MILLCFKIIPQYNKPNIYFPSDEKQEVPNKTEDVKWVQEFNVANAKQLILLMYFHNQPEFMM